MRLPTARPPKYVGRFKTTAESLVRIANRDDTACEAALESIEPRATLVAYQEAEVNRHFSIPAA